MAYSKVLNRPMFNKNNSAYGRGIASNLVTEEERQRFNYGGRVGALEGLSIGSGRGAGNYGEILKQDPSMLNWWDRYGEGPTIDWMVEAEKIKKEKQAKEIQEGQEKSPGHPSQIWDDVEEVEIKPPPDKNLPTDPDSDQLYTDEEKKEKRSQMMLSMAERLIGGSRDKWGSTAQMKNIAGAVGDIRKIADPSERREMLAKYKAWGKAQAQRDITSREHQYKMERDPEYQMEQLMVEKRVPRSGAINQVYGTEITSIDDSNRKKINKKYEKGQLPEGFVAEIAGSYNIIRNGKWVKITEEEIIKNSPRKRTKKKS